MQALAGFIMTGRLQAVGVMVLAALLALLLPPLLWVSGAALALVVLRMGTREGLYAVGLATLATGIIVVPAFGGPLPALVFLVAHWLPILGLATVLRTTVSLALTLQVTALAAVAVVLAVHAVVADPQAWWVANLETVLGPLAQETGLEPGELERAFEQVAGMMTGIMAASFVTGLVLSLLIGRWWQALLYNPGGFQREFHGLRLGQETAIIMLVAMVVAAATRMPLLVEAVVVLFSVYVFQGLAIVHGIVGALRANAGWLVGTYALLVLFMPHMLLALVSLGVLDAWVDFRGRVEAAGSRDE